MFKKIADFGEKHKILLSIVEIVLLFIPIVLSLNFLFENVEFVSYINDLDSDSEINIASDCGFAAATFLFFSFFVIEPLFDLIFDLIPFKKKNKRISSESSD